LVFALFGSGVLAALDLDGKIGWRQELPRLRDQDHNPVCTSPVLYEDTVIIPGLHSLGLRALDKTTGQVRWEQKIQQRNTMSTPALIRIRDRVQLIHHAGGIQGSDPATGEVLWSCRAPTDQSSPVYGGGLLYADAGGGGGSHGGAVIDPTGKGDVSKTHVKWQTRVEATGGSSAIIVGDHVYRNSGQEFLRCRALANGDLVWEARAPHLSPSASPVATPEGRIYFASPGRTYVLKAGPKLEVLAVNDLDDVPDFTSPAIAGGRIFIKGKSYLWCVGKK